MLLKITLCHKLKHYDSSNYYYSLCYISSIFDAIRNNSDHTKRIAKLHYPGCQHEKNKPNEIEEMNTKKAGLRNIATKLKLSHEQLAN